MIKAHTSVHSPGIAPGHHNGVRPGGNGKSVSAKTSSIVVLGEVLVARVVPLVIDAVIGHTWSHRSCCYRRFRRSHF